MGKSKKSVQIVILLAIILVGVYAVATVVFGSDKVPKVGQKALDFELLGMDGSCTYHERIRRQGQGD